MSVRISIHRMILALGFCLAFCRQSSASAAVDAPQPANAPVASQTDEAVSPCDWPTAQKEKLLGLLPPSVTDGLDVDFWGWFSYLRNDQDDYQNIYDIQLSLSVTKSFNQRVAVSGEVNYINANGSSRAELEQGFASLLLSKEQNSLLTVGKFNANFGVEARDFWNRTTGTTSLLFGAQPQDLVGVMLTQPIGQTGVTIRPFISADFQGEFEFNQPPSGGFVTEYRPNKKLDFAVTNWVGPGFVLEGGQPLHSPFPPADYGDAGSGVFGNWQGPNLHAMSGSTLYFIEAMAVWQARPDLTLSAEFLQGSTGSSLGRWGWWGAMALINYDISDQWHLFAMYSYLDDSDWIVTGIFQRVQEVSGGVAYQICKNLELRGEVRHDASNAVGSVNSVSIHLDFGV
jgi:Putative beta-barrel porin-2, OmpL-like. bbp2